MMHTDTVTMATVHGAIDEVTRNQRGRPDVVVIAPRTATLLASSWLVWTAHRALSGRRRVTAEDLRRVDARYGVGLMTTEAIPRALRLLRRAENRRRRRLLKRRGWR